MKILAFVSTIDLKYRLGCTPAWWQLFKALYELGHEVVVVPYLGAPVESLWWRTYENPCEIESRLFNAFLNTQKKIVDPSKTVALTKPLSSMLIKADVRPKVRKHLRNILRSEGDIDALIFINIPLNHINGIPSEIKSEFGIPLVFYDGDMPTILPEHAVKRGFRFNYYEEADLSEYDLFFVNSKGVIEDLKEQGARNVHPLYYAADPDLFSPISVDKNIDVSFFGYGSELREDWMKRMITGPSHRLRDARFVIGGGGFDINLGNARLRGDVPFSSFREFCCSSKICLNITRSSHTSVYASATARPFELAAFGSCIVSQPYNGIEEWFDVGKELLVVNSEDEAVETYEWLLSSDEDRERIGALARERILKEHTYKHRAERVIDKVRHVL